jgi:hypothetical protein
MDRDFFGPQNGIAIEHHGGGPSAFAWTIFALLLVLLLIALVSLVLDFYYRSNKPSGTLSVLDERYARGEITRAAYLQARTDLGGKAPAESEATTEVTPPARRKRTPPATAT